MLINPILSAILRGQFLLEESAAQSYMPIVASIYAGTFRAEDWREELGLTPLPAFRAIHPSAETLDFTGYTSLDEVPAGSASITTIEGVMLEDDSCFSSGTATLGRRIQAADAHANIACHVVIMKTPGGSVSGIENFSNIISATKKPLVVYAVQMCSAGYWAGSGANRIVAAGRTAMIGSIGTRFDMPDASEYLKNLGYKNHTVNATDSYNKNAAFDSVAKGDYKPLRSQLLDPINDVFLSTVRTNRAGKLPSADAEQKEVLSGLVFVGETNVAKGLADQLGTLQEAVQIAFDLASEADNNDTTTPNPSSISNHSMSLFDFKSKNKFGALVALANKETISAEEATAANKELHEAGITSAALITEANYNALAEKAGRVVAAEKEATTLKASEKSLKEQLTASQAEVTRLGALPGATSTTAAKTAGDQIEASSAKPSFFDPNAEHNKEAMALLG